MDKNWTPTSAADGVGQALKILEGKWKLVILFHLFGGKLLRFSELERGNNRGQTTILSVRKNGVSLHSHAATIEELKGPASDCFLSA